MIGRFSAAVIAATTILLIVPATIATAAHTSTAAGAAATTTTATTSWQRAALIYHSDGRTQQQWEQHLMAVNAAGQFTGKWLFDAAIVTTQTIDGQDIMDSSLTGTNLTDLLTQEFADAAALDSAAAALTQQFGAPPKPIEVALALPWLDPQDTSVTVPGNTFNLSIASQRVDAANWYLQQVQSQAKAANWSELSLYGVYNQREDASTGWGDPSYLQAMNAKAHALGLNSIWVPYYDGPDAFSGTSLGFDVTSIQPEYSFRDAQYEGTVNESRLYSAGTKAAGQDQSDEYELSSQGNSVTEEQVAHQYLAVAQATGASAYPQVFFTGLATDLFDQVSGQGAVDASEWQTYTDLTSYLAGQTISNTDLAVPWSPSTSAAGSSQQTTWTLATAVTLTSIRVDFSDASAASPWRGQVAVSVTGPGGTRNSYAVRTGSDTVNPAYNSVFVPLPAAASGNNTVTSATITITRESGSPWPTVLRVVGSQYDPPTIANGNGGATSTGSPRVAQAGQYSDSQPTSTGYYAGKLTDGQVSSSGTWDWSGVVGWNSEGGPFQVTINLGQAAAIGSVALVTHSDQTAGINWPNNVAAAAAACPPQDTGITGQSCAPVGTSGQASLASQLVTGSDADDTAGTITLPMSSASGQYVTVTGTCSGWCMLDEIKVLSPGGSVLSTGASYTVVPTPTNGPGGGTTFGDDDYKLTDGTVIPVYGPQFANAVDGIPGNTGGSVQATWTGAHSVSSTGASSATVWMTPPNSSYGVLLPASVTIAWRDASGVWQAGTAVTPKANCGPGACASLALPSGAQVTGVKATFPGGAAASSWYMISEVSTQ